MKIGQAAAFYLKDVPIETPPFRDVPSKADGVLVKIETTDGVVGWSLTRHGEPMTARFLNSEVAPRLVGEDPLAVERIWTKMRSEFSRWKLGELFRVGMSAIDIALWDIKGKAFGQPVHVLLGGASDKIPVYITHGAAYGDAPRYSPEELAAEASHLVQQGNTHLKNTVGRQRVPDPDDDYVRMRAIRDAVGPDVRLAMDADARMSVPAALKLCKLTDELDIAFFEEPVYGNDPFLLADLKRRAQIPLAAAEREGVSCRDLLLADSVDIIQPNVNNDGGYTGGMRIASVARAFGKPIGHGNGAGPHNIALQAALSTGSIVEYHFHRWMMYNAIFEAVPQPVDGFLHASQAPGVGLEPKSGLVSEHAVDV